MRSKTVVAVLLMAAWAGLTAYVAIVHKEVALLFGVTSYTALIALIDRMFGDRIVRRFLSLLEDTGRSDKTRSAPRHSRPSESFRDS